MNTDMLIVPGDTLLVITRRADDGTNDGSLIKMKMEGHAYCIAKAPRYASDDEWRQNAELIADAIRDRSVAKLRDNKQE